MTLQSAELQHCCVITFQTVGIFVLKSAKRQLWGFFPKKIIKIGQKFAFENSLKLSKNFAPFLKFKIPHDSLTKKIAIN